MKLVRIDKNECSDRPRERERENAGERERMYKIFTTRY